MANSWDLEPGYIQVGNYFWQSFAMSSERSPCVITAVDKKSKTLCFRSLIGGKEEGPYAYGSNIMTHGPRYPATLEEIGEYFLAQREREMNNIERTKRSLAYHEENLARWNRIIKKLPVDIVALVD